MPSESIQVKDTTVLFHPDSNKIARNQAQVEALEAQLAALRQAHHDALEASVMKHQLTWAQLVQDISGALAPHAEAIGQLPSQDTHQSIQFLLKVSRPSSDTVARLIDSLTTLKEETHAQTSLLWSTPFDALKASINACLARFDKAVIVTQALAPPRVPTPPPPPPGTAPAPDQPSQPAPRTASPAPTQPDSNDPDALKRRLLENLAETAASFAREPHTDIESRIRALRAATKGRPPLLTDAHSPADVLLRSMPYRRARISSDSSAGDDAPDTPERRTTPPL